MESKSKGGPKTTEGKAISKYNAIKHGLLSKEVLVDGPQNPKTPLTIRKEWLISTLYLIALVQIDRLFRQRLFCEALHLELLALYLYWWSSFPAWIIDSLYNPWWSIVITEQAAHIDVSLFLLGLLFLLGSGSGGIGNGGTHGDGSNGGSWADVGEEVLDVLSLEGLGEEGGPVCLNLVAGGLNDLSELVTLNISLDSWTLS